MAFFDNDRWRGMFVPEANAPHLYTLIAWRDRFESWRDEVSKKHAAGVDISVELIEGKNLVAAAMAQRPGKCGRPKALKALVAKVDATDNRVARFDALIDGEVAALMKRAAQRDGLTRYPLELRLTVDRKRAAFSAWYELMPRSMSDDPHPPRHLRRRDPQAALRPRSRLRRALLPADPSDRPDAPQGQEQYADARRRTIPAAPTPSARKTAATTRSTPSSAASTTSPGS